MRSSSFSHLQPLIELSFGHPQRTFRVLVSGRHSHCADPQIVGVTDGKLAPKKFLKKSEKNPRTTPSNVKFSLNRSLRDREHQVSRIAIVAWYMIRDIDPNVDLIHVREARATRRPVTILPLVAMEH